MNKKPIIGIVAKSTGKSLDWTFLKIVENIRVCLVRENALTIGILPTQMETRKKVGMTEEEKSDLEAIVSKCDGIVLGGGLNSHLYEEEIVRICIKKDIPLIGICAGFNNMVRAVGGSIHKGDIEIHRHTSHEIVLNKESKLYSIIRNEKVKVNSIHKNVALKDEIKGYKIVATCPIDNTVEAIEYENKRFIMGIK